MFSLTLFLKLWPLAALLSFHFTSSATGYAQQTDINPLVIAAKGDCQPVSPEQVDAARNTLVIAANRVEQWIATQGSEEQEWRTHLAWNEFREAIAAEQSDFRMLDNTYKQLNSTRIGLELSQFRDLSNDIRRYRDISSAATVDNLPAVYAKYLDALASDLQKYEKNGSPIVEYNIGRLLDDIKGLGVSPELISAINARYGKPNILADASGDIFSAAVSRSVDRHGPVRDCILGTTIRGTSHTTGMVKVRLIPADDRAIVEFRSGGNITSQSRGYNGPVVIRSTGYTRFLATKRVEFTDPIFHVMPSTANANTRTHIHSVRAKNSGLFSGFISRVGSSRAQQSKGQAERIASRHAERDIRSEFDDELLKEITDLRRGYRDEFRYPLMRQGAFPEHLRFSSTSDLASVELTQATRAQIGASSPPPTLPSGHDMVVRVHQTAVSNYAAIYLSGATLVETPDTEASLDVTLPEWLKDLLKDFSNENAKDSHDTKKKRSSSISFRKERPISIAFSEGQATLTVHTASIKSGQEEFKKWDIVASYELHPLDGSLTLKRVADIELFPTGFAPESGQRLPTRYVGIRANLNRVINDLTEQGDGFPLEIELPKLEPKGQLESIGPLWLQKATSEQGWLTMAWDRN